MIYSALAIQESAQDPLGHHEGGAPDATVGENDKFFPYTLGPADSRAP